MTPHPKRGYVTRAMAAAVSAALFASSFGPGTDALAADFNAVAPEAAGAQGGGPKIAPLAMTPAMLAPVFSPLSAPSVAAPSGSAAAAAPDLGGHARPQAAVASPSYVPAAAAALAPAPADAPALSAPADGPIDRLGQWLSNAVGRPSGATPSDEAAAAPADAARESAGDAKARAGVPFGEDAGASASSSVDEPAAAATPRAAVRHGYLSGLAAAEKAVRAAAKSGVRSSARSRVAHLRLLRVSVDLTGDAPRWTFAYHEPVAKEILTIGPGGAARRQAYAGAERPAMLRSEQLASIDLDRSLAALEAAYPGFRPVRAEVVPAADGYAASFVDASGRSLQAPALQAAAAAPVVVPSPDIAAPAPAAAPETPQPLEAAPSKYVYEDALGFRTVRGMRRDPSLGRLPADADVARIIAQISGQFGIPREDVLKLGSKFRLDETSPRAAWLAVYDRLQDANRNQFKRFDSKKYDGWSSFRELANKTYAPGWSGALQRAAELHKALLGALVRFPYHLFDMFLFGYFRQAAAFEFRHSTEDFLSLSKEKDMARKWLEVALRDQAFRGTGMLGSLRAQAWYRQTERYFVTPLAKPLATFLVRRLSLAIMSAVAMGLLGAFAPVLPLSFALTSIPLLGHGIVLALNYSPVLVASVPLVGHFFAPVVGAALGAISKELVLGPLLNTMILSTLLTFPAAARERMAQIRDMHPQSRLTAAEVARAVAATTVSWDFWRGNLKSFVGLTTVGAEIAGIMQYAGKIDDVLDPGFKSHHQLGSQHAGVMEMIGSAVERPKGQSAIMFGGAITWGNALLYKLEGLTGYNITDHIMNAAIGVKSFVKADATDASKLGAAQRVRAAEGSHKEPFDEDLWRKSPAEIAARVKELSANTGDLDKEIAAVKAQMESVRNGLSGKRDDLGKLKDKSTPLTPAMQAEYDKLMAELAAKRDDSYVKGKLSEAADLRTPKADTADDLAKLKALQEKYKTLLPPPPPDKNGYWEQLAVQEASYKALSARLKSYEAPKRNDTGEPGVEISQTTKDSINKLLGEIETQRDAIRAEMTQRDATASLIKAANTIRTHALNERRNGQDMMAFHTDFAKLATVMDLALSLNEIAAAQKAIGQMENLLQSKQNAINLANQQNQQNAAQAAANAAQVAAWTTQAQATIQGDQTSEGTMATQQSQATTFGTDVVNFQQQITNLLGSINAMDKGSSANAAAQYQADLALIPKVAQWRTSGNPNNPSAFSLTGLQADKAQINTYLAQAQAGLAQIQSVPVQFAGALVMEVPGPAVTVSNPTPQQTLQILAARTSYWQQQLTTYQNSLNTVNQEMNPNYVLVDEFGMPHSYNTSVANMAALHAGNPAAGSKADAQADLAQLDKIATELNAVAGAHIPLLSGLTLTQLQTAMQTYGDALTAVSFPTTSGTMPPAVFQAKADLMLAAQLTPMAARAIINWSVDDATVSGFNSAKAPGGALTVAQQGLTGLIGMLNNILADVQADVAFVNTGAGGGQTLINRKIALLNNPSTGIIPMLTQAQSMANTLITYQQSSIAQVTGNSSQYYTLFNGDLTLLTQTQNLYNTTMPWSLASFGGSQSNAAGSLASIANWKQSLNQYMTGYTDSNGVFQEGVTQEQQDMKDRQCATGCSRTEVLYGETQPYSLPQKVSQYGAEATTRATEINTQDAKINQILAKIQALAPQYNLSAYTLPVGIGTDAGSQAKITALVNANTIQKLGTELQTIGNAAQAAGGGAGVTIPGTGGGTVPVGTQPSPTINTNQQIALLALAAGELLVPSPNSQASATNAPEAFAVARYVYANAVVSAAQTALTTQIPQAVAFLNTASAALGSAIAQTNLDVAYVNSNGTSESPSAIYARKVVLFQGLASFLAQGQQFYILKAGWDQGALSTITQVGTYYNALYNIYTSGQTVNASETTAINTMLTSLQNTANSLTKTQQQVSSWMSQLDPAQQSALANVSNDVSKIQAKTRAVLEANINWHDLDDQMKRSQSIIAADLSQTDAKQRELADLLEAAKSEGVLPPELAKRVADLGAKNGAFSLGGTGAQPAAVAIKKADFSSFLDTMIGMLKNGAEALSTQDAASIKSQLLGNPAGLAAFMPGTNVMNFGEGADAFYLVYQSQFSVPHGLTTGSWITLGNVAQIWGSNISINGYEMASPPSSDGSNAPYGDKGVEIQVESLQNHSSVNYLNVDLHRFGLDIPATDNAPATYSQSRLMVFDDYAMMLLNNKLYVGLTGYGDMALNQPGDSPYYYGGNLTTSLKLNAVMSLDASQQNLFVSDPRQFLENINLNFTGYDPSLNQNFAVMASGDSKYYNRTQIGPTFDVNRLMNPNGGGDTFTVSIYAANTSGSDDITQKSGGATVVKGFSIKNDQGKTWLQINNSANAEIGTVDNKFGDTLSFTLPDKGVTLSAQGQLIGGQETHYAQLSKKTGENTSIAIGYGSQYVGENNRLSLTMNSSFTLAQIWQRVSKQAAENLKGGKTLHQFNADIGDLFDPKVKSSRTVAELAKVYETDVAHKLISSDIGALTRDIAELRKAGAFLDNTRVRGMIGFTSNAVSTDQSELAVAGGPSAGTYTEMSLSKTQKALIQDKAAKMYREGLQLQDRLLEITRNWQQAVLDVAAAQWKVRLALQEVKYAPAELDKNGPAEPLRAEAEARLATARDELDQAVLRYNAMTGRAPDAKSPFEDLNAQDLAELMDSIKTLVTAPDRYVQILSHLDEGGKKMLADYASTDKLTAKQADKKSKADLRAELGGQVGKDSFNVVDWLPFVDRLTVGFGIQYGDAMNSQALTLGMGIRLPIFDPASKDVNKAYMLDSKAALEQMASDYRGRALRAVGEREQALASAASAAAIEPQVAAAEKRSLEAIREYRNGLITADQYRSIFDNWRWHEAASLKAASEASLSAAQARMDEAVLPVMKADSGPARIDTLEDAFATATGKSHDLAEVADRVAAADAMRRGEDHRIQKFWLDLNVGSGLTATGLGFLPTIGITGVPITPILGFELKPEELRELQVHEHKNQEEYYKALKIRLEAAVAVQFYQDFIAYDAAQKQLALYQGGAISELQEKARNGGPDEQKKLDQTYLERDQTAARAAVSLAGMNLLLGRKADAPLELGLTPEAALASLTKLLASKNMVQAQKDILARRVEVAKAVEGMIDNNLKVDTLQLEPVSIIVRSLGRLMGALGGKGYDADAAAAARLTTATAVRAQDDYDAQRLAETARLNTELHAKQAERVQAEALPDGDPFKAIKLVGIDGDISSMKASLAALGAKDEAAATSQVPATWAQLEQRLAEAEKGAAPVASQEEAAVPAPQVLDSGLQSGAYMRYDYAQQTIGHQLIEKGYVEGWIEVRLKNPNTPPEVLLQLSKLRSDRADKLRDAQIAGASGQASVLAAEFNSDVRLMKWADDKTLHPDGPYLNLDAFKLKLKERLDGERNLIRSLLNVAPPIRSESETKDPAWKDPLDKLALNDASASSDLSRLDDQLIRDIRSAQVDTIRRTLFENGLPAGAGEKDLLAQIDAKSVARMMSYKGFTPIAAAGVFRGTPVAGAFLEAPDPRSIARALENVISEALRKQLESDGQLHDLSLHMYQLMTSVSDGAKEVETARRQVEAAEGDLKARTALAKELLDSTLPTKEHPTVTTTAEAVKAATAAVVEREKAQQRLLDAWSQFDATMVNTKSAFVSLVSELQALGQTSGLPALRDEPSAQRAERSPMNLDPLSQLADYWTGRMADPAFAREQDSVLSQAGVAAPSDARARIIAAADLYRLALKNADAIRNNDFDAAKTLDLLTRNDAEGKRVLLRAEIEKEISRLGVLGKDNPATPVILGFFAADAQKAADAGGIDRAQKRGIAKEMRRAFLEAGLPSDIKKSAAVEAAFNRLEELDKDVDTTREALLAGYLSRTSADPRNFLLKDVELDAYLKAQSAFDAELAKTLDTEFKDDDNLTKMLDGIYDLRASLERSVDQLKAGRGMGAIDALIMLEETRLRAARWSGRTPTEIDRVAEALQNLRDMRAQWADRSKDVGLDAVYALTVPGPDGQRTWSVKQWMTLDEVKANREKAANREKGKKIKTVVDGDIYDQDGGRRSYIKLDGVVYELVGGVDAAQAELAAARKDVAFNEESKQLSEALNAKGSDFVAVSGLDESDKLQAKPYTYDEVFGANGLYASGRVYFFGSDDKGYALTPLEALSLPPDQVAMRVYNGKPGEALPSRDLFPTRDSLEKSQFAGDFQKLIVSPSGALKLGSAAVEHENAEQRRGWIEVKLNSYGFARDKDGRMTKLYGTKDEWVKEWNDFKNAVSIRGGKIHDRDVAQAEADGLKGAADNAQAAFNEAKRAFIAARAGIPGAEEAQKRMDDAAQAVQKSGRADGPEKTEFNAAVRAYDSLLNKLPEKKAYDADDKAQKLAEQKSRAAAANVANKQTEVDQADERLAHSQNWTLYRSEDLDLSLDASGGVVHVALPASSNVLPPAGGQAALLNEDVAGGKDAARHLKGELLAAVVDDNGRVLTPYTSEDKVDADAKGWKLMSYSPTSDLRANEGGTVHTKLRISHYEDANGHPILLSERFLKERLDHSKSKVGSADHWAIMPYNWGNILLEIPREVVQLPAEVVGGRDLGSSHYLGRAQMYKNEGGEEQGGFFRSALGFFDVLNLLPDHVERYYDPSQLPETVHVGTLKPGEALSDKHMVDNPRKFGKNERKELIKKSKDGSITLAEMDRLSRAGKSYDLKFGKMELLRQRDMAQEDLNAARERTLARFNGGVEQFSQTMQSGRGSLTLTDYEAHPKFVDGKKIDYQTARLDSD
ncbi:MAG: hypothetical protein ACHQ49_01565, partial [Elusimicrobiota bacterium]